MSRWLGQPSVKGNSESMRMLLLTCNVIGISFVWGIEQTYCTPYLLSLGLTKSKTSLVWIAGPLSGLIVQPIVGVIADESKSKWGRRRPFIMAGAVVSGLCLLTLGFTKEIVSFFIPDETAAKSLTVFTAVLAIYAVDFAVNVVMSAARSLVVDTLPISKQQTGSAWGSRMSAIGHGIAYGTGAVDLPSIFGTFFGDTQFKQLTIAAAFGIVASCAITSWAIGETYFRYDVPRDAKDSGDALGEIGRVGSEAFIIYSIITFLGAWILPFVVKSPDDESFTHRPPQSIKNVVEKFNKYKPDLLTVWMCGHATFAAAMFFAPFATSFRPWNVASWAPSAFLGVEVNKLSGAAETGPSYRRLSNDSDIEMADVNGRPTLFLDHGPEDAHTSQKSSSTGELSGIYFGILNIYTTIPQFIGTLLSTVVFAVLEPGKSPELAHEAPSDEQHKTEGPNAIAVVLFIGAMGAVVAIFATRKLRYL
ncbi:putative sucrose transport protein [Eutypa lata UCREL1]|uniref:Putative sucrose transport protein n=1 Tax=Eutypa lata (strain UCR-EL1) TaxID=1287681 RepID=M7SQ56_EUTLA|nr:putative sucrose transport protein [Eutypa lata UCREL1]